MAALVFTILLVLSPLLVHEMGHWAMLHRYGVRVQQYWLGLGPAILHIGSLRIGMLPIGGAVVPDPEPFHALSARKRMLVALAGPVISLLYALVLWSVWKWFPSEQGWKGLQGVSALSAWLAVINIIPVPPLDGFQALAAWKEHRQTPFSAATMRFAERLGAGLVYGIGFFVLAKYVLVP